MNYIRKIQRVTDNKVVVEIPEDFLFKKVEILIIPAEDESDINSDLMKVSEGSFKEWDNNEDDIYDTL